MRLLTSLMICVFFILLINPVYASIETLEIGKSFYANDESIKFSGVETNGSQAVSVVIRNPSGNFVTLLGDPFSDSDGKFETIAKKVSEIFTSSGIYNATGFSESQTESEGITLQLEYDGSKVILLPDYVLELNPIGEKTIEEEKTLSFTVSVTDNSLDELIFSLDNGVPNGASIDSSTGKFVWTPTRTQGHSQGLDYTFDVVVQKGILEDSESITVSVVEPTPEQKPTQPKPTPEPKPNTLKSIPEKKFGPAPFVDESKDPQSYVDRYNSEASYKKWFDDNYPEYSSIYEAVGLEEPKIKKPEFGECGIGTQLLNGKCEIISKTQGGGCLIATAAYGSELAPQVQFLREVRDNTLLSTTSGAKFMSGFNSLYYSFSPAIADMERESPVLREAVKLFITPMLSTLSIMTLADEGSESQVLGLGISIIVLNLGMYIAAPVIIIKKIRK